MRRDRLPVKAPQLYLGSAVVEHLAHHTNCVNLNSATWNDIKWSMAQHTFIWYKSEPIVNRIIKKFKNNEIDTIVKHSKPSEVQKKIVYVVANVIKLLRL